MAIFKYQLSDFVDEKNIFNTSKMFFSSYLCRVEFNLPAARLMYDIQSMSLYEFAEYVTCRDSIFKTAGKRGYCRRESDISIVDVAKLYCVNKLCQKGSNRVKLIIRGSTVRVYITTVDELACFLHCTANIISRESFRSIYRPKNEAAEEKLKNNVIFVDHLKFQYKVVTHEGKYNTLSKARLYSYLTTVDPGNVYLTPHFVEMLKNDQSYLYGTFFVNDPQITLFATLIEPTFINKIYKLEDSRNK